MLVLSRRERQRIRLGDSIVLTVVRVSGDRVRLGIDAPKDVLVLRDELEEHSTSEQAGPAQLSPSGQGHQFMEFEVEADGAELSAEVCTVAPS